MADVLSSPTPGDMTVPPLFGWETLAAVLVLLVVLGLAAAVLAGARAGRAGRSEWQAWLDARSRHPGIAESHGRPAEPGHRAAGSATR